MGTKMVWWVLDQFPRQATAKRKKLAKKIYIAPVGHLYDKMGRWIDVENPHFWVRNLT